MLLDIEDFISRPDNVFFVEQPKPFQMTFQNPHSSGMEAIVDLHHEIMFYMIIVVTFVL
jgi:heme/copper-type cytochrome/quinol oxidase subunit 2